MRLSVLKCVQLQLLAKYSNYPSLHSCLQLTAQLASQPSGRLSLSMTLFRSLSIIIKLVCSWARADILLFGESFVLVEDEAKIFLAWVIRIVGTWSWQVLLAHLLLPDVFALSLRDLD